MMGEHNRLEIFFSIERQSRMLKIDDRTLDVALVFDYATIISRWVETRRLDHRFLTHAFCASCLDKAAAAENNAHTLH